MSVFEKGRSTDQKNRWDQIIKDSLCHSHFKCRSLFSHWMVLWCKTWPWTTHIHTVHPSIHTVYSAHRCTASVVAACLRWSESREDSCSRFISPAAGLGRDDWGGGNYRGKQQETDVQLWEQRFALSPLIAPVLSLQSMMQCRAARSTTANEPPSHLQSYKPWSSQTCVRVKSSAHHGVL